jgi:hypothetical protein
MRQSTGEKMANCGTCFEYTRLRQRWPDEEVTQTPFFRNGIANITSYSFIARQERGILDRTSPVDLGASWSWKGLPASLPS